MLSVFIELVYYLECVCVCVCAVFGHWTEDCDDDQTF